MSTSDVIKKAQLTGDELVGKALEMVDGAAKQGVTLRVTGGIAVFRLASVNNDVKELLLKYRKASNTTEVFADIDLVGYSKETKPLNKLFIDQLHFEKDKIINSLFGDRRRIYYHPSGTYHVDIFLDKLEFNHVIDVRGRLGTPGPNLNDADLILSKLQIHNVTDKDLLDIIALGALNFDPENSLQRVTEVLSDDWGFWYDAVNNLRAASQRAEELNGNPCLPIAKQRIQALIELLEQSLKTKKWEKVAKRGTKKQWWIEIEDVLR